MTTEPTTPTSAEAGHYHAALHEIAEIVGCGAVYPVDLPGKVRELIHNLRADNLELEDRASALVDQLRSAWTSGTDLNVKLAAVEREQAADRTRVEALQAAVDRIDDADRGELNAASLLKDLANAREEIARLRSTRTEGWHTAFDASDYSAGLAKQVDGQRDTIGRLKDEVKRLTAENTDLRHALDVAETLEADVRLDVEREVRAEATEVGA